MIVQNRPGTGGTVGTQSVAVAPADGYTLLLVNSTHAINPSLYTKLSYDSKCDFSKLGLSARNVPLAEFDAYIRTDLDKFGPFVKASGDKAE